MSLDLHAYFGRGKKAGTHRALEALGVVVRTPTNEWEVSRFKSKFGVGVIYSNKGGKLTANPAAEQALGHLASGLSSPIPPRAKQKKGPRAVGISPNLIIFADASLDHKTGAAGWGCWIKAGAAAGFTLGGPLKDLFPDPPSAEAAALANALHIAKHRGMLFEGAAVMLQSDCSYALAAIISAIPGTLDSPPRDRENGVAISPRRKRMPPALARPVSTIAAIKDEFGLQLVLRHVRGHQDGDASTGKGRNWVNNRCDELAKAGMRARRDEIPGGRDAPFAEHEEEIASA